MSELPVIIHKGHQVMKSKRTETALGVPVVPLQVEFSTQRSSGSEKGERPCELEIDHVIFVQSFLGFFDNTMFPSTSFLPQQNLTKVDGAVDIAKHVLELLRLMCVVDDNKVLQVW